MALSYFVIHVTLNRKNSELPVNPRNCLFLEFTYVIYSQCSLEDRLVECGLAILSNLASRGDNLSRLRDLHTLDIILPFIHSPSNRVR